MRRFLLAATLITAAALAGCGKQQAQSTGSEETAAEPAAAPTEAAEPEGLTDAQKQTLLASLPAPYNTGDIANGKKVFLVCKSCHTLVQGGANMTGPNLYGVFGRKAGVEPGFTYSDDLKATGVTWDAPTIDKWIANPKAMAAGTKMSFVGVKNEKDRVDVIAYLKTETSAAPE